MIKDHSSLLWLHNLNDPPGRLARWANSLQTYNMNIIHRKDALHKIPDARSRSLDEGNKIAARGSSGLSSCLSWEKRERERERVKGSKLIYQAQRGNI